MQASYGISTTLTSLGAPAVESGHVAGWVGVGGPGQGPGGADEWIQVGLNSLPGTGNKLYYEVMRPGVGPSYAEVATNVANGRPLRIAVLETASYSGAWRVWVNGRAVTAPIALAGSHGRLSPMAMAESWDGGRPACNRYSYRFENVSIAASPGGSWQAARDATVLQDPGYRVIRRANGSFDASATRPLPAVSPTPRAEASVDWSESTPTRPATASQTVQVVTVRPVAATAPLRKGFLSAPTLEAIFGPVSQPAVAQPAPAQPATQVVVTPVTAAAAVEVSAPDQPDPGLGLGAGGSFGVQIAV